MKISYQKNGKPAYREATQEEVEQFLALQQSAETDIDVEPITDNTTEDL